MPRSGVAEELENCDRRAAHRVAEAEGVEDPDVRPRHAGGGKFRIPGAGNVREGFVVAVLTAVGGGDEGAALVGTGEDDIARLVADEQRPHDARRRRRDV